MSDKPKILSFEKGEAILLEEGIIENRIFDFASLEPDDIIAFRTFNQTLANAKSYVVLVESGIFTSISDNARKLVASKEFKQYTIAKALIAKNFAQELVMNFYMKVNRPATETRLFVNRTEAIMWLRKKIKEAKKKI